MMGVHYSYYNNYIIYKRAVIERRMADMNNNGGIMRVKRKTKTYESGVSSSGTTATTSGGAGLLSSVGAGAQTGTL